MDKKIRLGIIGVGNMGSGHARNVLDGKCPDFELCAVADHNPARLEWTQTNLEGDYKRFDNAIDMLDSGLIDACIVAVPHYDHAKYAMECMKRSIHVMVEKPAGVYTKQVREMNAEADKHPEVVFGMMFNQRTNCVYRKMRELVQSGKYGRIRRTNWIITNWYRPQAYYDSGDWRATWSGEGGGVLLNQAPHNLDLWQWICGMPTEVTAFCDVAKYHNIEVEDDATIFVRYANGATGTFITTTGEYPGTNRLEIAGDRGKLVLEGGVLKWWKLGESEKQVRFESDSNSPHIPMEVLEITSDEKETAHAGILQNFANAILKGEPLISPGPDGLCELTISNAAYLSQWKGNAAIPVPFDEAEFDAELAKRAEKSSYQIKDGKSNPDGKYSERWQVNW